MKVAVTVEVRCSRGSVAFQSQVEADAESMRQCRKELAPGQTWTWRLLPTAPERLAFFAAQSRHATTLQINGQSTVLEGQFTTDFGCFFARRGAETLGSLPFSGDLSEIVITNNTDKANQIDIFIGELPEPVPEDPEDEDDEEEEGE